MQSYTHLMIGPLYWQCPYPRALSYTQESELGDMVREETIS
jgi:hypothetical protein